MINISEEDEASHQPFSANTSSFAYFPKKFSSVSASIETSPLVLGKYNHDCSAFLEETPPKGDLSSDPCSRAVIFQWIHRSDDAVRSVHLDSHYGCGG
mmetsp:Transcript_11263/g.16939  ORF Transcript_11263/g.16939 Transcript_11263/m.16939 type:complete len:98 (+) Transcript_11263:133-426(+)